MKIKLLYLLLFVTAMAGAQIVNIPDANFKATLLSASTTNFIAKDAAGQNIVIDANGDGEIQQSEALLVYDLEVEHLGPYSSIAGVEAFTNLTWFTCGANELTDVSPVYQLVNLEVFYCSNNLLTTLDVSTLVNLEILRCFNNRLTQLTFGANNALNNIECSENSFTSLDFSALPALTTISFDTCPDLYYVNFKNGSVAPFTSFNMVNSSQIRYVCADEGEEDYLYAQFLAGGATVNVNTYCSVPPGGSYNTITGTISVDANGNGCDALDFMPNFIKVKIEDGANTGYTFTNNAGQYTFYTQAGTFNVMPQFEDNQYFTASPQTATVNFPVVDNSVATENFCITANGIHRDVEVVMVPLTSARPGFYADYKIVFKNKGNQTLSGSVDCLWDPSVLYPVSMTPNPDYAGAGNYSWDYNDLQPFENREILMTLRVNSPTDTPPVNNGDVLSFTALENNYLSDDTPDDNSYVLNQRVINSYDPNNIICIEGDSQPTNRIGEYLHYVVNFENTGTAAADFVVVTHEIDPAEFDINTLELLNASHNVSANVTGNTIEFAFRQINLAASFHGNILFKLKSRPHLHEGSTVANRANIYFDYNLPIETNEASTVFANLSRGDFNVDASVKIYPNPANSIVSIEAAGSITTVQLYDVQGRLLQITNGSSTLDVSARAKGIYFIKVITSNGIKVEKLIKQ